MTYYCILESQDGLVQVDFDGTYNEGGGPHLSVVNEVAVLDVPLDAQGHSQDQPMDMKYCPVRLLLNGQFKDGWGTMDWITPGFTKVEKLLNLQKLDGQLAGSTKNPPSLILWWPSNAKSWNCIIERIDLGEQGGYGNTITYDLTLRITAKAE